MNSPQNFLKGGTSRPLHRRCRQRQSGSWGLRHDSAQRRPRKRTERRILPHHQQPNGADGGHRRTGGAQVELSGPRGERQQVRRRRLQRALD